MALTRRRRRSNFDWIPKSAATADLGGGRRAIVPGDPEQSQLVRRITASDESDAHAAG